jgi:hypothetical protein
MCLDEWMGCQGGASIQVQGEYQSAPIIGITRQKTTCTLDSIVLDYVYKVIMPLLMPCALPKPRKSETLHLHIL